MYKAHQLRTIFTSWDVEKVHAVVARSTFPSQNVQKHLSVGRLLEVEMSKKCTPLWREAHFQVKMYETHHCRTTFGSWNTRVSDHFWRVRSSDVEKVHAIVAQSFEVKMFKTLGVRTTFGGSDVASLHYTTLHYTTLHYTPLHYTTEHYTTPHPSTLHYTTLHYTPIHSTTLNYTTPHYITPHYITLNDTAPQIDR